MLKMSQGMLAEWLGGTGSIKAMFTNGVLALYSGTPPASANDAETGTLLALITVDAGTFNPGIATNGINFDAVSFDASTFIMTLAKAISENWQGLGLADGTIGYGRFYTNNMVTGESTTAVRFDGLAAIGGGEFKLSSAVTRVGVPVTVDTCDFKLAMYRV